MNSILVSEDASSAPTSRYRKKFSWTDDLGEQVLIESTDSDLDWDCLRASNETELERSKSTIDSTDAPDQFHLSVGSDDIASSVTNDKNVRPLHEAGSTSVSTERDLLLAQIRTYEQLANGWDGPDSIAPKVGVVDDALTVLQFWPLALELPEPGLCVDGNIVLEVYDDNGLTNGGIEFIGDHVGIYSVIKDEETILVDRFDALSSTAVLFALAAMHDELS